VSSEYSKKAALVTGGARGIGKAIAATLAGRGWRVAVADVQGRSPFLLLPCDVSREADVRAAVRKALGRFGRLDALVNNAGIAGPGTGPVEKLALAEWNRRIGVNLTGMFLMAKHAVPHLRAAGSGLVLNVARSAGFAAAPQMSAYNATKAAVISLTETLAAELEGSGVQASVAMPGLFSTHLLSPMHAPPEQRAMARRIMESSGEDATSAARAILGAAADGKLHIVWPGKYRLAWQLKRLFPGWFVRRVAKLRDRKLPEANPPPA